MRVIYLDQNKWIDLARAVKYPAKHPKLRAVLETLVEEVKAGRVTVPLTSTNIYETHKINNLQRRSDLAFVQSILSKGLVFRGRHKRLEIEVTDVLRGAYGLPRTPRERNWFLSNVFFESFLEWTDPRHGLPISERVIEAIRNDPPRFLFKYLVDTPEDVRTSAVSAFSKGSDNLRQQIEERRKRHANESIPMRRRIQSAILMINELDLILGFARNAGIPERPEDEIMRTNARKIINDTPTYFIEREIALRIEAQTRPIEENG